MKRKLFLVLAILAICGMLIIFNACEGDTDDTGGDDDGDNSADNNNDQDVTLNVGDDDDLTCADVGNALFGENCDPDFDEFDSAGTFQAFCYGSGYEDCYVQCLDQYGAPDQCDQLLECVQGCVDLSDNVDDDDDDDDTVPTTCVIGFVIYSEGDLNPANPCEFCDPSIDEFGWSPMPADSACDDGLFCTGVDTCDGAGSCDQHTGDPCDPVTETCNEGTDTCDPIQGDCDTMATEYSACLIALNPYGDQYQGIFDACTNDDPGWDWDCLIGCSDTFQNCTDLNICKETCEVQPVCVPETLYAYFYWRKTNYPVGKYRLQNIEVMIDATCDIEVTHQPASPEYLNAPSGWVAEGTDLNLNLAFVSMTVPIELFVDPADTDWIKLKDGRTGGIVEDQFWPDQGLLGDVENLRAYTPFF